MFKYFLFSDTHGCYDELITALDNAGFDRYNANHILLGVGDYFDRGNQNKEIYNFLKDFPEERKYLCMGNHDYMLFEYLLLDANAYFNAEYNGLWTTINNLAGKDLPQWHVLQDLEHLKFVIRNLNPNLRKFLTNLEYGFKLDNFIITHAGFESTLSKWYDSTEPEKIYPNFWAKTPESIRLLRKNHEDFIFINGHWHASRLSGDFLQVKDEESHTFFYRNFIGLDAISNYTHRVNVYVIETDSKPIVFNERDDLDSIKKM